MHCSQFKYLLLLLLAGFLYANAYLTTNLNTINSTTLLQKEPKVIGGAPISISDASYQVSVRRKAFESQYFGLGHICGGSVISQRVVLTAAHCLMNTDTSPSSVRQPSEFTLVMGNDNLYLASSYTQQYDVLQIVMHAGFSLSTLQNDIALFFINGYIPWDSPMVHAIPLNAQPLMAGVSCTVTGFGKTANTGSVSSRLMAANVPIVSNAVCATNYGTIPISQLCAGFMDTGNVDACQGDSGGPLLCNGVLAGIVSWGYGCAVAGYPGVYTNVSDYYSSWIVTANATLDYSLYGDGAVMMHAQSKWMVLVGLTLMVFFSYILKS